MSLIKPPPFVHQNRIDIPSGVAEEFSGCVGPFRSQQPSELFAFKGRGSCQQLFEPSNIQQFHRRSVERLLLVGMLSQIYLGVYAKGFACIAHERIPDRGIVLGPVEPRRAPDRREADRCVMTREISGEIIRHHVLLVGLVQEQKVRKEHLIADTIECVQPAVAFSEMVALVARKDRIPSQFLRPNLRQGRFQLFLEILLVDRFFAEPCDLVGKAAEPQSESRAYSRWPGRQRVRPLRD